MAETVIGEGGLNHMLPAERAREGFASAGESRSNSRSTQSGNREAPDQLDRREGHLQGGLNGDLLETGRRSEKAHLRRVQLSGWHFALPEEGLFLPPTKSSRKLSAGV